jgi:hypothetical protein
LVIIIKRRKNVYKHSYQFHLFSSKVDFLATSGEKIVFLDHQIKIETKITEDQKRINKKTQFSGES